MVADDKIIHIGHFGQFPVAEVEHLAYDRKGCLVAFGDITQVQEGDQRLSIRFLGVQTGIAQHNNVIIVRSFYALQKAPVGGIAALERHFLIGKLAAFLLDDLFRFGYFTRDGRIRNYQGARTLGHVIIEFCQDGCRATVPAQHQAFLWFWGAGFKCRMDHCLIHGDGDHP